MKGIKLLALGFALVMALSIFAGCAANADAMVIRVGETVIPRWEFDAFMTRQLALYEKYNGIDLTQPQYKTEYAEYVDFRLEELVGEAAMREEARLLGLAALTAEEEAEVDQRYLDYYNQTLAGYMEQYGADDAGRKKAEQAYNDLLKASNLTPERMRASLRSAFIINKLIDYLTDGMPFSEEDVRAYYDSVLQTYQDECLKNPLWFGENYTDPLIYAPEGYRDTARISLHFTDKQLSALNAAGVAAQTALQEYQSAVQVYGEESRQAQKAIPQMDITEQNFNAELERCYQELEASIETIRQDVLNGADFIKTMEALSDDTHLISYFVTNGSTHVGSDYLKAAMALEKEGDISPVVRVEQGVCIIKLIAFVEPGVRPFEQVREELLKTMRANSRVNLSLGLQTQYAEQAYEEGRVEIFKDNIQ